MLAAVGVESVEDLFAAVPGTARHPDLNLPGPMSEMEVERALAELAGRNDAAGSADWFLGAGVYNHYRPATVDYVLRRGEFYTSYTPYQAEASQGMLQAMFEYQGMICRLTGMEVSNASHYDGATSLAEGVLLALDERRDRDRVVISPGVHPHYRAVVRTYLRGADAELVGDDRSDANLEEIVSMVDDRCAALVVQTPDFFGQLHDLDAAAKRAHDAGALVIAVTDPVALGLFSPPGAAGVDVAVADGQPLGLAPSFGGPHLGIFATRKQYVRRLVGRVVGETVDDSGQRGYVLTLATREQHIRRARATSNICTNAALGALGAAVYLATLGKTGLRRVAELCYHKSHYAAARIAELPGVKINPQAPGKPFFKEFVASLPAPVGEINDLLRRERGIVGGYDLGAENPALAGHMLVAVTETNTRESIDRLVDGLRAALS